MKILLVTPPLTQLNTSYPATCQLVGFLKSQNIDAGQMDLSIELVNALFTKRKLNEIFDSLPPINKLSKQAKIITQQRDFYTNTIESVMRYIGGNDSSLAVRFSNPDFWPVTKRTPNEEDLEWAFGLIGNHDKATHLCTLFLRDLCDLIKECINPHFELIRYAESLCIRLPEFEPLHQELQKELNLIDRLMLDLFERKFNYSKPEFVGFTVPFPGNLYAALRCAQWLKANHPDVKICMGGGYVNTELRQLSETRLFDYIDFLTFDDGELPLLQILNKGEMIRTMYRNEENELIKVNLNSQKNIAFKDLGTPTYKGLVRNNYINLIELTNPMHALWSNGRWNKLTLAHGCYWAGCSFCDCNLDYINRYETAAIQLIVDRMEAMIEETGVTGFHLVDEAAPPAVLRQLAEEILKRKLTVSYWGNVRFEKAFTPELCYLMAQSGCIAISGGLEVASDRILQLINKGITIDTASESMKNFTQAGIMTHAYLMYGFPTETAKETIASLEVVRSLFEKGWLQSAFWHRYAMTMHSPSGMKPESVGAKHIPTPLGTFANNEIPFTTDHEIDLDFYAKGLQLATYNYMQGVGYDVAVKEWFK